MSRFETRPADIELQAFADPGGITGTLTFELIEVGDRLTARPFVCSIRVVWMALSIPLVGMAALYAWKRPFDDPDPLFRLFAYVGPVGMGVVCIGLHIFVSLLNRQEQKRGDFFVLDWATDTLTLPRLSIVLHREQVTEVVEVHGWHRDESGSHFIREVSVLARGEGSEVIRVPVLYCGSSKHLDWTVATLANHFGVPCRKFVQSVLGGWRRVD